MSQLVNFTVPGNLGTDAGAGSDGVLIGQIPVVAPTVAQLKTHAAAPLCFADDGGAYTNYDTEIAEDTADDVPALPATPADDDAFYIGYADDTFSIASLNLTQSGVGTWDIVWQYWDGDAWQPISDVTDGTTGFTAAAAWCDVTFTAPADWAECTVDSVEAYWIRAVVDNYSAVTTQPLVGQGYVSRTNGTWTVDTTDFTDAGAGDVDLLPAFPYVGDGFYIGHTEKFCKLKVTTSQARTGTATITLKYWNGTSWANATTVDDDSVGWSATAGTLLVHFVPPADWALCDNDDGPNGAAGYFVCMELTAKTSVTQQPQATQGWVMPTKYTLGVTEAAGIPCPIPSQLVRVACNAGTVSGTTQDSVFLLANVTRGTSEAFTWTKGDALDHNQIDLIVAKHDQIALVQITEDGTTEFADANFSFMT